jgi:hypothetical protein
MQGHHHNKSKESTENNERKDAAAVVMKDFLCGFVSAIRNYIQSFYVADKANRTGQPTPS